MIVIARRSGVAIVRECAPSGIRTGVGRVPIPWWWIASVAVLGVGLAISLKNGHAWDSVIIAVLVILGIAVVAAVIRLRFKTQRNDATER
jgi:integral membrane sensor domain MASE1